MEKKGNEVIDTLDGAKGFFIDAEDSQNFDVAIKAVQEKAEREKGCKYCNDASFKQSGTYVDSENGSEILGINHYCMNCGRKLKEEN